MNSPATKLAAKGTLVIAAITPKGASMPTKFETLEVIVSTFTSKFPVLQKITRIIAKIARVTAMPETLRTTCPTKYPATPPITSINNMGLIRSCILFPPCFADNLFPAVCAAGTPCYLLVTASY